MDARKFIIGNVGPIGCIPYQKTINQLNEDECVALPNQLALRYNSKLKDLVAQMNDNLPGATFVHANVYDLVMELITNYAKYGGNHIGQSHAYIRFIYIYIYIYQMIDVIW